MTNAQDTTPARAEALDEGAAGEPAAWQKRFYGIDGKPSEWEPSDPPPSGGNPMMRILEYRALYACPSSPPAADEDRMRSALSKAVVFNAGNASDPRAIRFEFESDDDRLAAANAIDQALAALKSTAVKEEGE